MECEDKQTGSEQEDADRVKEMAVWTSTATIPWISVDNIIGLPAEEKDRFRKLLDVYNSHVSKNEEKNRYYEGKISLNEVNLGIALPEGMRKLEIGCAWGAKTVDVLAGLSMFDGFVGMNGEEIRDLDRIVTENRLIAEYAKACRDELKFGCTFATLSSSHCSSDPVAAYSSAVI